MQKVKRSKSKNADLKRSVSPKKKNCCLCIPISSSTVAITRSLYRKYSSAQNHHYLQLFNSMQKKRLESLSSCDHEEYLGRYYKAPSRRQFFERLKKAGKVPREIPRIFHPFIRGVLEKCYHRKRLLECFRMAKRLGIRVDSVNFSSFLLSMGKEEKGCGSEFEPVLLGISEAALQREV